MVIVPAGVWHVASDHINILCGTKSVKKQQLKHDMKNFYQKQAFLFMHASIMGHMLAYRAQNGRDQKSGTPEELSVDAPCGFIRDKPTIQNKL